MKLLRSNLILLLMIVWYGCPQFTHPALALDEKTANQLEYLRKHQLYTLAEAFCQERLNQEKLEEQVRVQLTLELADTYGEHAQSVSQNSANEYWSAARNLLVKLNSESDSPSVELLSLSHQANLDYSQAVHALRRWQLTQQPKDLQQTLHLFDQAISSFSHLLQTGSYWTNTRKELRQKNDPDYLLNQAETLALYRRLPLQLAETYLHRVKHLSNHTNASKDLNAAQAILAKLSPSSLAEQLQFKRHLLKAELASLKEEFPSAEQSLSRAENMSLTPSQQKQLLLAQVWLQLRKQNYADAMKLIRKSLRKGEAPKGKLHYLYMLTLAKSTQVAQEKNDTKLAKQLQNLMQTEINNAGTEGRDYWFLLGQKELESLHQAQQYGHELAQLINQAQQLYQAGEQEKAITTYHQIIQTASQSSQLKAGEEATFTLGSLYLSQKEFLQAAELFSSLPDLFPQSNRVNEAKLMQAYCLGQLLNTTKQNTTHHAEILQELKQLLQSLRTEPATTPVWKQSTRMLATIAEKERKTDEAILLYLQLLKQDSKNINLINRLYYLYSIILNHNELPLERLQKLVESGRTQLTPLLAPPSPENLTFQTDLRITLALLNLHSATGQFNKAAETLLPLLLVDDSQQQQIRSRISPIYFQILTAAGPAEQAKFPPLFKAQARELLNGTPAELVNLYLTLSENQPGHPKSSNPLLLSLQKKLDEVPGPIPDQLRLPYLLARLKNRLNDLTSEELLQQTNFILSSYRLNQKQLRDTALLLEQHPDHKTGEIAGNIWQEYEQKLKPGTEPWFEARWHQARLLLASGNQEAAQKLVRRTTLLHQFPPDSPWESKFAELNGLK